MSAAILLQRQFSPRTQESGESGMKEAGEARAGNTAAAKEERAAVPEQDARRAAD